MNKQEIKDVIRALKLCILGGTCKLCPYYKKKLLLQTQQVDYKEVEHFDCEWQLYNDVKSLISENQVKQLSMFSQLNSEKNGD